MSKILSGHMGNGLVIWRQDSNKWLAHINPDRTTIIHDYVTVDELQEILNIAKYDNRSISIIQTEKVFNVEPLKQGK